MPIEGHSKRGDRDQKDGEGALDLHDVRMQSSDRRQERKNDVVKELWWMLTRVLVYKCRYWRGMGADRGDELVGESRADG